MLSKAKVVVCSEINTQHINTVLAKCTVFECSSCWCIKYPADFKRLNLEVLVFLYKINHCDVFLNVFLIVKIS